MTDPADMVRWLDKRIASAMTWVEDRGKGSKRPWPENEINHKLEDIEKFEEIKGAYLKALAKRNES